MEWTSGPSKVKALSSGSSCVGKYQKLNRSRKGEKEKSKRMLADHRVAQQMHIDAFLQGHDLVVEVDLDHACVCVWAFNKGKKEKRRERERERG